MSASQPPTVRRPPTQSPGLDSAAGEAPLVLGRYRLHRRLGAGAFGTVWLARDERLDREVAVKIVPRERIVGGRFEREARAAARLAHPGIVTLFEAAVDDQGAYLVSELVLGATFDEVLEAGRLSDRDIVAIGVALCDALAHAHAQGIVHRDVKPSNVLIPDRPATPAQAVKLTDFGVARVIGGDSLTQTGDVVGTLAYMAPEQAEGLEVRASADLYSLALVIYEALTGVNPVRSGTAALRARRLGVYLPPLRRQRRDLPRALGVGIDLALRPRPRERGTLEELRAALLAALAHVQDRAGVVASAWPARTERGEPSARVAAGQAPAAGHAPEPGHALAGEYVPAARPVGEQRSPPAEHASPGSRTAAWSARALTGATAAALTAWLAAHLLTPSPLALPAAAVLAGALTLALPRVGWLALTATLGMTAAFQAHPGALLVILIVGILPIMLLARKPLTWPVSAAAPALGLLGLAGAWPALAARAGTSWRRAALGLTGWVWLLLAGPISDRVLYLPRVPGTTPASVWAGSLHEALHGLLAPLVRAGALAPAPVWAAAAVLLPWLVRGRSLVADTVRVTVWAATLASATAVAVGLAHGSRGIAAPPSAVLGAVAGALVALSPTAIDAWRARGRADGSEADLS